MDSVSRLPYRVVLCRRGKRRAFRRDIRGDIFLSSALYRLHYADLRGDRRRKQILDSQRRCDYLLPIRRRIAFILRRVASLLYRAVPCGMRNNALAGLAYTAVTINFKIMQKQKNILSCGQQ